MGSTSRRSVARGDRELVAEHVSEFGTKYVVDAVVQTPTGRMIGLRTVWIAHEADHRPRLVTAYPI